ncbi:cobalamin-dependent protein [Clostridium sp. WLY-B-L2]|uniref:Cobalamin-dependent protein n=1 Tax=Clostridium aromativorans TaxID=2836848 RepID=A0ABS8N759_9CLOT|nr:cobalamin-dependent protein [Clostridium aromativorans]MCC9294905.1 cobalamin-dependent protein [Clostridium aromativorans]
MNMLTKKDLIPEDLPQLKDLMGEIKKISNSITVGETLFMKKYGVKSEVEYKLKCMKEGKIMRHAHIGWNSWEETAKGFKYIYDELTKRGLTLDRFGVCLDWVMGVPKELRYKVRKGTGLIFDTPEEWKQVGQIVPIQPHFGDHMIGSLNSVENVKLALEAGVTTMGNVSQFYTYEYPGLMDKSSRVIGMVKAIGIMAEFKDKGALIHANLDDGFGAQFHDLANLTGWAMIERYIVEDLIGGSLSHCFGNLFSDPTLRMIFLLAMDEINDKNSVGSMLYGNTIDFSNDYDKNYGALSSFQIADMAAQMYKPTGHAVTPIPITEAVRVPSPDEIVQAHVISNMLEEKAKHYSLFMDWEKISCEKDKLVMGGQIFFERVMNGLDDIGIDIKNPCELFMALKEIGAARLEEYFGVGKKDPYAMRGRIPLRPTDIVWTINNKEKKISENIKNLEKSLEGVKIVLGATDVHEFGKEIVKSVLLKTGAKVFDLGSSVEPQEVIDTIIETESQFVVMSTFNGIALSYAKNLCELLKQNKLKTTFFMGGLLNENMDGSGLAVDVSDKLKKFGVICSNDVNVLIDEIKDKISS